MVWLAVVGVVGRLVLSEHLLPFEEHCVLHVNGSRCPASVYLAATDAVPMQSGLLAGLPVRPACTS